MTWLVAYRRCHPVPCVWINNLSITSQFQTFNWLNTYQTKIEKLEVNTVQISTYEIKLLNMTATEKYEKCVIG